MSSSIPEDHVPTIHFWTDRSVEGLFSSKFVCVRDSVAFVIVSITTILITYAGTQTWIILQSIIYFWRYESRGSKFSKHRLRLILRNSPSSFSTFMRYSQAIVKFQLYRRLIFHVGFVTFLALGYAIGLLIFGVLAPGSLTERTTTMAAAKCGYWVYNTTELEGHAGTEKQLAQLTQLALYVSLGSAMASSYVDQCYGDLPIAIICGMMIKRRMAWTPIFNVSCPFKNQCLQGPNSAFMMDTGLNTAQDFGINTNSRLTLRKRSTCAPIKMSPYGIYDPLTNSVSGYAHVQYNGLNATQFIRADGASPFKTAAWYPQKDMAIHPNLRVTTGNVSIIYVSRNPVIHLFRSEDPMFPATGEIPLPQLNMTGYLPKWDERVTGLACVDTLQLCNDFGNGTECSPWTGVMRNEKNDTGLEEFANRCSEQDRGLISLIFPFKSIGQNLGQIASGTGANLMAAKAMLSVADPLSGQLVDLQTAQGKEQWIAEVSQWFSISLAIMQLDILYLPISDPFLNLSVLVNEIQDESQWICNNVKIRTTFLTSIRYLYVVLILIWAIIVTLLPSPGKILAILSRTFNWDRGKQLSEEWDLDDLYRHMELPFTEVRPVTINNSSQTDERDWNHGLHGSGENVSQPLATHSRNTGISSERSIDRISFKTISEVRNLAATLSLPGFEEDESGLRARAHGRVISENKVPLLLKQDVRYESDLG